MLGFSRAAPQLAAACLALSGCLPTSTSDFTAGELSFTPAQAAFSLYSRFDDGTLGFGDGCDPEAVLFLSSQRGACERFLGAREADELRVAFVLRPHDRDSVAPGEFVTPLGRESREGITAGLFTASVDSEVAQLELVDDGVSSFQVLQLTTAGLMARYRARFDDDADASGEIVAEHCPDIEPALASESCGGEQPN